MSRAPPSASTFTLLQPGTKRKVVFYYGALGVGPAVGFKLPKLGKITGVTGSIEDFPSAGTVRMCKQFKGSELSISDINGGCSFMEVGAGLVWGKSQIAMLFGMDPMLFAASLASPDLLWDALKTATGYVKFGGLNFGIQAGAGAAQFVGLLRASQ